nr:MAG TPA: hypothetical protein [Caudoviricetes sp.]
MRSQGSMRRQSPPLPVPHILVRVTITRFP